MNLLRCPFGLIFLPRISGFSIDLFNGRGLCDSHTSATGYVGSDLPAWAGAI